MISEQDAAYEVVTAEAGRFRGLRTQGVLGFKGIPYGASTNASGRFELPQPTEPFPGIRDALRWGQVAPQGPIARYQVLESWDVGFDDAPKGEDCLVLNVWTPDLSNQGCRPVMVFLHGGGYHGRSGSRAIYDGGNLARHGNVVVVTINHRLNVFGYLSLGHLDDRLADSGNAGTLDTILALR